MTCEGIIERLVDGCRPAEDPQLAAHLGSCLRCYRAAADLRDLPQLAGLLREVPLEEAEPGAPDEAFWRSFPGTVGAAWVSSQQQTADQPAALAPRVPASPSRRWGPLGALQAWLRRPMPAALAGAACAAAVAFVVVKPMRNPPPLDAAPAPADTSSAAATALDDNLVVMALEDLPLPRSQGLDESVRDLDTAALAVVLEGLDRELGTSAAADYSDLPGGAYLGDPSEDLDDLDLKALEVLRDGLGSSI